MPFTALDLHKGSEVTVGVGRHLLDLSWHSVLMLNPDNFLLVQAPNDPNDPVIRYWTDEMGSDPNLFGENDPNIAEIFDRDSFFVDLNLPIFADSDLRIGPDSHGSLAQTIINSGTLYWYATVGGYGANVIHPCSVLQPLAIYPYDGMPTYLPARYSVIDVIKTYGKPYYSPFNRSVYGSNSNIQNPVRLCHYLSQKEKYRPFRCNNESNSRMDRSTGCRGMSMGYSTGLFVKGSNMEGNYVSIAFPCGLTKCNH